MNKAIYWIIGIVIAIVLIWGGYKLVKHYKNAAMTAQPAMTENASPSMAPTNTTATSNGLMNKTDSSNAQLDKDLQDVQGSMDKLNADQTQADQTLSNQSSDTPVAQ